ncbi:hypothetical protein L1987_80524 [Smallanthus sonchifolius]|uniref:Uncharacterized protein n=1 Tax=Smallanthus sonchifolius TaxID=185202 RepID=A0ACB8YP42_9ASTR|nr:hypothetical protein L1987_80524 [Smallanthus sonchifolius]
MLTALVTRSDQIEFQNIVQAEQPDVTGCCENLGMSVIGFDIGNESCVIATERHGEIDVLFNYGLKRETPAVVSFGENQRFLGSAGANENPESTISHVKRLIGKQYKDPNVQYDLGLLPFKTSKGPRGGVLIHYLDAASIAGLTPLRLIHDCTAIALGYGVYKTNFPKSGPANVLFVDIGHCDTQVSLVTFEQGKMNILSHSFDEHLGGRDFDDILCNHFAAKFKAEYNINAYLSPHSFLRLRASCEKLKKVLSVNAQAEFTIKRLVGDTDVKGVLTRKEFEILSLELLERITVPCINVVKESGLSVDKIYAIELSGSGSHIPAISKKLTSIFWKEPRRIPKKLTSFVEKRMSVTGFDIGNESCVIAAERHGEIDALFNYGLKRETPTVYKDPNVQYDLRLLPFKTSEGLRGGVLIHTVTGIPSYFTDMQRREYLDAAFIAGLTPLRLIHDCTAIALGYGVYKTDFLKSGPANVLFVDIRHCDTQVSLATFEQGKMNILSHSFDEHLGGRDFDDILCNHFAAKFEAEYNIDAYSSPHSFLRLRASCEKLKKVLSAKAQAELTIKRLVGDTDVKGVLTRKEFEILSLELLERITVPCINDVKESGLSVDKIYAIELSGSGSHIPAISKKFTSIFWKEPRRIPKKLTSIFWKEPRGFLVTYTCQHTEALHEAQKREHMLTEQDIKAEQANEKRNTIDSFMYNTPTKVNNECSKAEQWLNDLPMALTPYSGYSLLNSLSI